MRITKAQLQKRSFFEMVLAAIYSKYTPLIEGWERLRDSQRTRLREINGIFYQLKKMNETLNPDEDYFEDSGGDLTNLSFTFDLEEKLKEVINFVKMNEVIEVPKECEHDPYYEYFEGKLEFKFY